MFFSCREQAASWCSLLTWLSSSFTSSRLVSLLLLLRFSLSLSLSKTFHNCYYLVLISNVKYIYKRGKKKKKMFMTITWVTRKRKKPWLECGVRFSGLLQWHYSLLCSPTTLSPLFRCFFFLIIYIAKKITNLLSNNETEVDVEFRPKIHTRHKSQPF